MKYLLLLGFAALVTGACGAPDPEVAVGTSKPCVTCSGLVSDWYNPGPHLTEADLCPSECPLYEAVYDCMADHVPECSQGDPATICPPFHGGMFEPPGYICRVCLVSQGWENTLLACGI